MATFSAMNETVARYEFRVFAPRMGITEHLLRTLAPCESITEDSEIYLLDCTQAGDLNVKIRHDRIDVKRLVQRDRGLEQWKPDGQLDFPLPVDTFYRLWGSQSVDAARALSSDAFSLEELLRVAVQPASHLQRAKVFKRRFRFSLAHCSAEHDYLLVNGASLESIAIESEHPDAIIEIRSALRLEGFENQAYPLMLCRLLGRLPMPGEDARGY
tara:strand:+ start:12745 stop:13386 length:642 start_codon:yes stop_codon:yes gene_type:complete